MSSPQGCGHHVDEKLKALLINAGIDGVFVLEVEIERAV